MYETTPDGEFAIFRVNHNIFDCFKGDVFEQHSRFIMRGNNPHLLSGSPVAPKDYQELRKFLSKRV